MLAALDKACRELYARTELHPSQWRRPLLDGVTQVERELLRAASLHTKLPHAPDLVRETTELIPGARFELIRGAGHLPCIETPDAYAALLTDFLTAQGHAG